MDSSNSSQKPKLVIDRLNSFYSNEFSNVGRSVHTLAVKATNKFEDTRDIIKSYINAKFREEIIFTKGTTESIHLNDYVTDPDTLKVDIKWSHVPKDGNIEVNPPIEPLK